MDLGEETMQQASAKYRNGFTNKASKPDQLLEELTYQNIKATRM